MRVFRQKRYVDYRRYQFEMFTEWLTGTVESRKAVVEPELISLADRIKTAFQKGSSGKMKELLLDCIQKEFTTASENVKQYANSFVQIRIMMKEVEEVYKHLMNMTTASKLEEDEFIDKNLVTLGRYCTQLLKIEYFPEHPEHPDIARLDAEGHEKRVFGSIINSLEEYGLPQSSSTPARKSTTTAIGYINQCKSFINKFDTPLHHIFLLLQITLQMLESPYAPDGN